VKRSTNHALTSLNLHARKIPAYCAIALTNHAPTLRAKTMPANSAGYAPINRAKIAAIPISRGGTAPACYAAA
jgi:hypothetical protein